MIDGLNVAASFNGGGVSTFIYDVANTEEMQVSVSGSLGEAENGGPQVNLVPKSGGNIFSGSAFYSGAGSWSSGDNLNDTLRSGCGSFRSAEKVSPGIELHAPAAGLNGSLRRDIRGAG